jgi:hypothetical protein
MGVVAGGRERSRQGLHFFVHECDETAFQRLVPAELQPLSLSIMQGAGRRSQVLQREPFVDR